MSSGRAKYLASILNWCGGRLAYEEGGTNKGGGEQGNGEQRAKRARGEKKIELTLTRMDLRMEQKPNFIE